MDVFKVDDKAYPGIHVKKLTRQFNITDGQLAGRNVQGDMIRDVVGTYYNYTLELSCTNLTQEEYYEFYEVISSPVDAHKLEVPYNDTVLIFDAYITSGEDELKYMSKTGGNIWQGMTCGFIAMKPAKKPAGG